MILSPDNLTQIIVACIAALGGVVMTRSSQRASGASSAIQALVEQLAECQEEREKEREDCLKRRHGKKLRRRRQSRKS